MAVSGEKAAFTLKQLGPQDMAVLEAMPEGVFDYPIIPAQAAAFLNDPQHEMVVAFSSDGTVIGMASATVLLHPDKPPSGFVNELGVPEGWRRQGVATALCHALFTILRARGCEGIWLATEADNAAARGLYHHLDGRETAGIVVYDWDGAMDPAPD